MNYTLKYFFITIFIISFYACSDDSGTDPSDEFVGATFQLEDGMEWEYDHFQRPNQNEVFDGKLYVKCEFYGEIKNRQSFKQESKYVSIFPDLDSYSVVSTDNGEYSAYLDDGFKFHSSIQEQTRDQWFKMIDFKNESWSQFDIKADSVTPENKKYTVIYKRYGNKVEDLEVEYKEQTYNATKYKLTSLIETKIDGQREVYMNTDYYMTVIEGIGIYKTERYEDSIGPYDTEVLVDNK
jgi:hypothetical protein